MVAIDVQSRREERDLLDFLKKGTQLTRTVHDILKKARTFTELSLNKMKIN